MIRTGTSGSELITGPLFITIRKMFSVMKIFTPQELQFRVNRMKMELFM